MQYPDRYSDDVFVEARDWLRGIPLRRAGGLTPPAPAARCGRGVGCLSSSWKRGQSLPGAIWECRAPFAEARLGYVPVAASDPTIVTV